MGALLPSGITQSEPSAVAADSGACARRLLHTFFTRRCSKPAAGREMDEPGSAGAPVLGIKVTDFKDNLREVPQTPASLLRRRGHAGLVPIAIRYNPPCILAFQAFPDFPSSAFHTTLTLRGHV